MKHPATHQHQSTSGEHFSCQSSENSISRTTKEARRFYTRHYKFHYTHSLGILDSVRILNCKQFDPRSTISVKFTDDDGTSEQAVDLGGRLRQFPCLLLQASILQSRVFQGPKCYRVLCIG